MQKFLVVLQILISTSAFSKPNFDRVAFFCDSEQDQNNIQRIFQDAVSHGIEGLEELNPQLALKAQNALSDRDLVVSCSCPLVLSFGPQPFGEYTNAEDNLTKTAQICYHLEGSLIPIQLQGIDKLGGVSARQLPRTITPGDVSLMYLNDTRGKIFHEFMHFAQFDNLSWKVHNKLPMNEVDRKTGMRHSRKNDIVYSCQWALFPSPIGPLLNEPERNENFCTNFKP